MNDDQTPPPPPQGQPQQPPAQKWDSTVNPRALGLVVVVVAMIAVIGIGLSMCTRVAGGLGSTAAEGNNILENRVDQAFDNGNEQPAGTGTTAPGASGVLPSASRSMDPAQRQIIEQEEQMRDAQRAAVPSVLPENPPRPVPLGGKNY